MTKTTRSEPNQSRGDGNSGSQYVRGFDEMIVPSDFPEGRAAGLADVMHSPNCGLLWHRYMTGHGKRQSREAQSWFIGQAEGGLNATGFRDMFRSLSKRRAHTLKALGAATFKCETRSRCIIGGGNPSAFENSGATFHHAYGIPIIPGASLKGLMRHYLEEEYEKQPEHRGACGELRHELWQALLRIEPWQSARHKPPEPKSLGAVLCGDSGNGANEGLVSFHDAWPIIAKGSTLFDVDVLTVHHKKYYEGAKRMADDTENPVPVHFLTTAKDVEFAFALSLSTVGRRVAQPSVLEFVRGVLVEALWEWGIGARTGSGYGLMREIKEEQS